MASLIAMSFAVYTLKLVVSGVLLTLLDRWSGRKCLQFSAKSKSPFRTTRETDGWLK